MYRVLLGLFIGAIFGASLAETVYRMELQDRFAKLRAEGVPLTQSRIATERKWLSLTHAVNLVMLAFWGATVGAVAGALTKLWSMGSLLVKTSNTQADLSREKPVL